MGFILGCIWYFFTASTVITALAISTVFIALWVSTTFNMPYYGPYEAFGDTQFVWIALLVHDRFIGPYSKLLSRVAKHLPKRRKAATVSDDYEFNN